jgi:hypothetical protein
MPISKFLNKVAWQQVGYVTEPGRYMFRFGWLTIVPDDLAIWTKFPDATFTLVQSSSPPIAAETDEPIAENDEFHLGAFDLHLNSEADWSAMLRPVDDELLESQSSV